MSKFEVSIFEQVSAGKRARAGGVDPLRRPRRGWRGHYTTVTLNRCGSKAHLFSIEEVEAQSAFTFLLAP